MKVVVDADVCAGHGVCVGLVPHVFELTDDGYTVVKVAVVPVQHEAATRTAVGQCPTHAIEVTL